MGTRSTTRIFEDNKLLLALYKQYDGYLDGWGKELKEFIQKGTYVNGFNGTGDYIHNGAGCFTLQLVKHFKETTGGLYAIPANSKDQQEYNYQIKFTHGSNYELIRIDLFEIDNPEFHTAWRIENDKLVVIE